MKSPLEQADEIEKELALWKIGLDKYGSPLTKKGYYKSPFYDLILLGRAKTLLETCEWMLNLNFNGKQYIESELIQAIEKCKKVLNG